MANCNKPKYYECYAKIVLEELYPKEFVNLKMEDKPDLQMEDGEYGIEVTNSVDKKQLEAERLYTKISNNTARNKKGALEEIRKCGCKLENGILSSSGTDSFNFILSAFDDKLNKLNKDYICFERNCLFIFSDISADDRMIMEAIQDMQQRQINMERQFNEVFVLVPGYSYRLNLDIGSYERYPIESERQTAYNNKTVNLLKHMRKH
ncbi:hypothetical protein [Clostridium sp. UBA4395]|uniref:hypothetical protein n=1 Tax=Clostridium sp. UBA4395 TaxID=1946360 RepID=UPI0032172430